LKEVVKERVRKKGDDVVVQELWCCCSKFELAKGKKHGKSDKACGLARDKQRL
jgi:hypothetical protein